MNKNHLKLLRDPFTGEDLDILIEKSNGDEIIEGLLKSSSNSAPIYPGWAGS